MIEDIKARLEFLQQARAKAASDLHNIFVNPTDYYEGKVEVYDSEIKFLKQWLAKHGNG